MLKFKSKQATLQDPIVLKPKSTHICGDLRAENAFGYCHYFAKSIKWEIMKIVLYGFLKLEP